MNLLEIKKLTIKYAQQTVVSEVSFPVQEGQWLMIVGPNGAGKSTILNAISRGLPYEGTISFKGKDIQDFRGSELARHLGVLAQNHAVGYDFTVNEVVNLGRYAYRKNVFLGDNDSDQAAIRSALKATGLTEMAHKSVLHLSGGEVQRTFLAQLFAQQPDIMILDEPGNHLDLVYQKQVFELINDWLQHPGRAVISVVHDLSLARAYGTHGLLLHQGKTIAYGDIHEVLKAEHLNAVYEMDVYAWMQKMLGQWDTEPLRHPPDE